MPQSTFDDMPTSADRWNVWLKLASVVCTSVVLPGIAWAWNLHVEVHELRGKVDALGAQMERDSRGEDTLRGDINRLRETIESMRADVLQRLAKVETKLEVK